MTQLAIFETRTGREDIKLAKYYKSDYARLNVLKTAVMVTIGYVLIVGMVALYKLEYLLDNALKLDYKSLGLTVLGIYIGVMAVYLIFTLVGFSIRYMYSRNKLARYFKMLSKLKAMLNREEEGVILDDEDEGGIR